MDQEMSVVLLADSTLLRLPLEAMTVLQTKNIHSVARDFSLQMLCHRIGKFTADESSKGGKSFSFSFCVIGLLSKLKLKKKKKKFGLVRESNPGPLAPEARIIPLDQQACTKCAF